MLFMIIFVGLGPRKFRSRAVELGDQSVWTDTAADKARKVQDPDNFFLSLLVKNVKPHFILAILLLVAVFFYNSVECCSALYYNYNNVNVSAGPKLVEMVNNIELLY